MLKFPVVGELVHHDPTLCVTEATNKLEVGQITDTLGHVMAVVSPYKYSMIIISTEF